jgi:hypothetical protein
VKIVKAIVFFLVAAAALAGCSSGGFSVKTENIPPAYNIEAYDCTNSVMAGSAVSSIEETLSRLPAEFPKLASIENIYVCEGLKSLGVPSPAAAIHADEKTNIYLNADAKRIDQSLTHELFHALEYSFPVDEEAWAGIDPDIEYLKDQASPAEVVRYTPNMIPAFEPGFATDYARFSAMEDRAELFTVLYSVSELTPKERAALLSDRILLRKIEFLKEYLAGCGISPEVMKDNLLGVDTFYTCSVYKLNEPDLAFEGPGDSYPSADLKSGDQLADSGFEKNGFKMLYTEYFSRVYVPAYALELIEGETIDFNHLSSSPK